MTNNNSDNESTVKGRLVNWIKFVFKNPFQFLINVTLTLVIFPGPILFASAFLIYITYEYGIEHAIGFDELFWYSVAMVFACILFLFIFVFFLRQITTHKVYTPADLNPFISPEEVSAYNEALKEQEATKKKKQSDHKQKVKNKQLKKEQKVSNNK